MPSPLREREKLRDDLDEVHPHHQLVQTRFPHTRSACGLVALQELQQTVPGRYPPDEDLHSAQGNRAAYMFLCFQREPSLFRIIAHLRDPSGEECLSR